MLGDCLQFGFGCNVHCDITLGSEVLIARDVAFIGKGSVP
jgi:hypothetical protein